MPKLYRCIHHDDSIPSMAVYEDGKYYCFGCKKSGKVNADIQMELDTQQPHKPTQVYTPKMYKNRYVPITDKGMEWLKSRAIKVSTAINYGIVENPKDNSLLYPLYVDERVVGYQKRNTKNKDTGRKYITYPDDKGVYPEWCIVDVVYKSYPLIVYIVESVFDGLVINQYEKQPAIVLLGTQLNESVWMKLQGDDLLAVKIWFDEDAILDACHYQQILKKRLPNTDVEVIELGNPYEYYYTMNWLL